MAVLEQLMVHLGVDSTTAEREARRAADGIERAMGGLKGLGATVGKAFALGPALAPALAAVGGMTPAFASAGAGAGAFFAAVKPQFADITDAADLYTKAMEAQAEGGEKAKAAMAEYKAALADMPAATRATATGRDRIVIATAATGHERESEPGAHALSLPGERTPGEDHAEPRRH